MRNLLFLLPLAGLLWACDDFRTDDGETRLQWSFAKETELLTRSLSEIPDTNDFLLTISDAGGKVLYNGPYGLIGGAEYRLCSLDRLDCVPVRIL